MPVHKARSVEELPDWSWLEPDDPRLLEALQDLHRFSEATVAPRFPPGVYRHRSIEDMNAQTQTWADDAFARYRERLDRARPA